MKVFILFLVVGLMSSGLSAQNFRTAKEAPGLSEGAKAPDFTALDATGQSFQLKTALKQGPVVLIFYRGHWCPYCSKHLSIIQDSLQYILNMGASVVAISPEKPEYLEKMAGRAGTTFQLLYDEGYKVSDAFDVTFAPKALESVQYNTLGGANLKEAHSDDSQRLPIPATFIIDPSGTIVWRQFDPDYKKRSSVKDILAHLP